MCTCIYCEARRSFAFLTASQEGHDYHGMYRGWWRAFNYTMQFWVGPFFGQVPNSYGIAHNKIHHRWHNDLDDVHTNLDLDRTQLTSFLIYLPRFALYWSGVTPLLLFLKRREWRFALKMSKGMAIYYAAVAACIYADPMFGIFYVLFGIDFGIDLNTFSGNFGIDFSKDFSIDFSKDFSIDLTSAWISAWASA